MEVVATGKLTTFPGQSRYQMVIEHIAPAGVGALMAMLEKRKAALAAEGLFDAERKRKIPYLPEVIGVITSPSGAVIRDILHRLRDRFPRKVLVWPVAVQGDKCAPEVVAAINGFNQLEPGGALPRPDLLIVARGGGSIEDLWGFNEEAVVRAAAASDIPLISAVGHETDTTLIDFASDQRAPTPTAAAELAVPVRAELLAWLASQEERRVRALSDGLARRRQRLRDLSRALPNPAEIVDMQAQRLDVLGGRLPRALQAVTQRRRALLVERSAGLRPKVLIRAIEVKGDVLQRVIVGLSRAGNNQVRRWNDQLNALERLRETLGYQATLERGYAVVRNEAGRVVSDAKTAAGQRVLEIQFKDGRVMSEVANGGAAPAAKPALKPKKKRKESGQGSLF
jgi:exodeoxyribonuclease VII large subunit